MRMKKYIILITLAVLCQPGLKAQQNVLPSRSLTIEGAYNPSMTEQGKILPVPEKQRNVRQSVAVSYLTEPSSYTDLKREPMGVFSQTSDSVRQQEYYGLARFGYGLRNLSDGLFDFGWHITESDFVKVYGNFDGWSSKPDDDWRSRMFKGNVAAEYAHRFNDRLSVGLGTDYGFSRFNYMPGSLMNQAKLDASNLTIDINEGSLWGKGNYKVSNDLSLYLTGGGEWLIRSGLNVNGKKPVNKEGIIRISAGADKLFSNGSHLTVDLKQKTKVYSWHGLNDCKYYGFTAFTVSPVWHYSQDNLRTSLGLNLDIRTNAGETFLMSPFATLDYDLNERYTLNIGAVGGLEEYDMRKLARISPYWSEQSSITDGYNVANFYGGITFNQGRWLILSAKMGYRFTKNEVFQTKSDSLIVTSVLKQQDASVFYLRFDADMHFSDKTQFKLDLTYSNYIGSYRGHKMDLKPAFDANVFGRVNIIKGLDAMLSYRFMVFHWVLGKSMPTVNDLSFTLDYDFNDRLSFYTTVKHLMGGDFYYYAGYRSLKPAIMLGASYRF